MFYGSPLVISLLRYFCVLLLSITLFYFKPLTNKSGLFCNCRDRGHAQNSYVHGMCFSRWSSGDVADILAALGIRELVQISKQQIDTQLQGPFFLGLHCNLMLLPRPNLFNFLQY